MSLKTCCVNKTDFDRLGILTQLTCMPQTQLKRNYRKSENRDALISLLEKSKQPLTGSQILKTLQHKMIYIHKSTLYRSLFALKKEGLVREIGSGSNENYYIWNQQNKIFMLFKCQLCESRTLREIPTVTEKSIHHFSQGYQFKIDTIDLEITGTCSLCQK